jgi:hypothetical protein
MGLHEKEGWSAFLEAVIAHRSSDPKTVLTSVVPLWITIVEGLKT